MLFIVIVLYFYETAERDYVPIIEVVEFRPQEIEKSVKICIVDDKRIEHDETFFLYLTSGEGVYLSPFSTAEVVIKNDGKDNYTDIKLIYIPFKNLCYREV